MDTVGTWEEQRKWGFDAPLEALEDHELRAEIEEEMNALEVDEEELDLSEYTEVREVKDMELGGFLVTVDETTGEELTPLAHSSSRRVFAEQTAEKLQKLLAGVVAEGTGQQAAPSEGTAAGKTGTAQTGQFRDGEELKNYWFAGFYPAEKPRWTIVVMQDAQTEPEVSSAAIFARLCDALSAGA